jgi:hypothetical protein
MLKIEKKKTIKFSYMKVTPLPDIGQNKTNILNMKFETQDAIKIM